MYIKLTAGYPKIYSIGQLKKDNPNTSFPKLLSDALLAEWGVYPYTAQARPDYDRLTQAVKAGGFVEVGGAWTQVWTVSDMTAEDAAQNVRDRRDHLLQETDWMALSDVVMEPYWAEYRQQLRDITAQEGFPFNVVWPTKP
jgi:hypothetical protein